MANPPLQAPVGIKSIPEVLEAIDRALPFVAAEEHGEPREALEAAKATLEHLRLLMAGRQCIESQIQRLQVESARSLISEAVGRV